MGVNGINHSPRADEMSLLKRLKRGAESLLSLTFLIFSSLKDWMMPITLGEGHILDPLVQMLISSGTPSLIDLEIIFNQISGHPLIQSR